MTTLRYLHEIVLPGAYALLPDTMNSPAASAMLLAIALQESKVEHRRQVSGPAKSFWQFERAGIHGVLTHSAVSETITDVIQMLRYRPFVEMNYVAVEHNDVLAACFARCLLWTLPDRLPTTTEPELAYAQYLEAWRPGKPHPDTWNVYFAAAWAIVRGEEVT